MVRIDIYRNAAGAISGFTAKGHADTAPHGQDIVCAGIAALTQSAVLGLKMHLNREIRMRVEAGDMEIELLDPPDAESGAILETMLLGLTEIAKISSRSVRISEHRR